MFHLNSGRRPELPADPAELIGDHDSALLDLTGRVHAALAEIDGLMKAELKRGAARNVRMFNALLDVKLKLAPGSTVLPLRPTVPVIPGRAS